MKTVVVSGGFDPVHVGHIRMFKEARSLGDELVVLANNDNWLMAKKGFVFMNEEERVEVLESIKYADKVMLTNHSENPENMSVSNELKIIQPDIFANGGDRKEDNIPEYQVCGEAGITMVFNVGGEKAQSSSELVKRAKKKKKEEKNIIA